MFMSMAPRLMVFREARCWLMPVRTASASLSCFLQPAKRARRAMTVKKQVERFMGVSSSSSIFLIPNLSITHSQDNDNVQDGEEGKGITERAVNDVPQSEDLLGAGQEENALGQGGLSSGGLNGHFEFGFARGENTKQGNDPGEEPGGAQAQPGNLERAFEVQPDHPAQGGHDGRAGHLRGSGQGEEIDQTRADFFVFILGVPAQLYFGILNFLDGQLGGVQGPGNLGIQIAADEAAGGDGGHDPEGHAGNASEFKGRVQGDDERGGGAQDDVEIQPVAGGSPSAPPPPRVVEGGKEDGGKKKNAQKTPNDTKRAPGGAGQVVVGERGGTCG